MTRLILGILALALMPSSLLASQILKISANQSVYQVGESAQMRIRVLSPPASSGHEFFLTGAWNGTPVEIKRVTETEFYYMQSSLVHGNHLFSVEVFVQDRALAQALTSAISFYDQEISRLSDALLDAQTPEEIEAILAEISDNQRRRSATVSRLNSIRRKVGGVESIQIQVL